MGALNQAFHSPAEVAARFGCSERTLRKMARDYGLCRVIGKVMMLTDDDVQALLEAMKPCPSPYTDAGRSGTTAAPLPAGSYADLVALRTKEQRSALRQKKKPQHGEVISMARRRS